MRHVHLRVAVVVAMVVPLVFINRPALAGLVSVTDASGVDFDAACILSTDTATTSANNIASPGAPGGSLQGGGGCESLTTYDGRTEATDLRSAGLSSAAVSHADSNTQLTASWTADGVIPAAGSTCNPNTGLGTGPCADLPDRTFVGFSY